MTDVAPTSPYVSKLKKPSPIKSTGIPKLAASPAKATKLPTSKPVTRTVSASAHSNTTGHLPAPPSSDDNPPNTPSTPTTPGRSPSGARKSVGGSHRLHSPSPKEAGGGGTGIPSYAKPTVSNSSRLPYSATAGASSIPAPKSILKKPVSPSAGGALPSRAAAVTQRLTSTQPLPPATHSRSASTAAVRAVQTAGKHTKQSSLALSSSQSRIPGLGSAGGSKGGSVRASTQSSARTSRQGSIGSAAAAPASPELASILAQAQAAQAQVAEVQEAEAELHGRAPQRHLLAAHSRGHSRTGSVASNASNASAASALSPQSAQHDSLLDEHDPLDDIDVDTSFDDDITRTALPTEINSAPVALDDSAEAEPEDAGQPQQLREEQEYEQGLDGVEEGFAETDDVFEIIDPAQENGIVDTPIKPAEHEEKTQDVEHTGDQLDADETRHVEQAEESKQSVIISAPQAGVQERRLSNVHELSATPEPELEEKEDKSHTEAIKAEAQSIIDVQVVRSTVAAADTHTVSANTDTLSLDNDSPITVADGDIGGLEVRKTSLSHSNDATAPVTADLVIGATTNQADDKQDEDEYGSEIYEDDQDGPAAAAIVLSANSTVGDTEQILRQEVQPIAEPAPAVDTHEADKIELITDEQAELDSQQQEATHRDEQAKEEAQEKSADQVEDEPESAALTVVEQPTQQAAQFTTIIIDRDQTDSFDTSASPPTRTPAPTVTEQPDQANDESPLDLTLLPTRTPAPSSAVPAEDEAEPTEMVIESPATAFPSTLTSFDTLTASRDQPSVSVLEPVIRAPAPSAAAPVSVAPAAGATTPVVKSVAFSDDVTALGEGKEERSESLDFGDDLSLPSTPLRGSVVELPAAGTSGSSLQPIASLPQYSTDNSASIHRLKQLEAERRADEDKRRADEAETKRQATAQATQHERTAEAEQLEQQQQAQQEAAQQAAQQAEQKVREQLEESKRSLFAQLREGVPVTKLGKKGSPRDTRIFISGEEEGVYAIHWDSKSKKPADARMPLADCRCVVGGDEGMFVHRKYAGKYDDARERCVSVVSAVRGLDVVLRDEEAVNRLVAILRLCGCPVREAS